MVKRIEHNAASAVATTGWGAVKGALGGALFAAAVGGLLVAGAAALGGLIVYGSIATAFTGGLGTVTGIGIAAASVASFLGLGLPATVVGGVMGGISGAGRVGDENAAAARSKAINAGMAQQQQAAIAQQSYMAGVQDGQQSVVQKLQQAYHEQMVQKRMMDAAQQNPAGVGPQSAKIRQQQQAAQAAGASVA